MLVRQLSTGEARMSYCSQLQKCIQVCVEYTDSLECLAAATPMTASPTTQTYWYARINNTCKYPFAKLQYDVQKPDCLRDVHMPHKQCNMALPSVSVHHLCVGSSLVFQSLDRLHLHGLGNGRMERLAGGCI